MTIPSNNKIVTTKKSVLFSIENIMKMNKTSSEGGMNGAQNRPPTPIQDDDDEEIIVVDDDDMEPVGNQDPETQDDDEDSEDDSWDEDSDDSNEEEDKDKPLEPEDRNHPTMAWFLKQHYLDGRDRMEVLTDLAVQVNEKIREMEVPESPFDSFKVWHQREAEENGVDVEGDLEMTWSIIPLSEKNAWELHYEQTINYIQRHWKAGKLRVAPVGTAKWKAEMRRRYGRV